MNEEQYLRVVRALKLEVLDLLQNTNMMKPKEVNRTLVIIDNSFKRLNADIEEIFPPAVLQEYVAGLEEANAILYEYNIGDGQIGYKFEGMTPVGKGQKSALIATLRNQVHFEAIAEINENTMMDLKSAIRTAHKNTELSIVNTLTDVQRKLQSGLIRGRENKYIQSRVMDVFNREGFTSFIARDGRQLPLDFYSQVVTRTNLKLARTKGSVNRYKENDVRLFKVSGNRPTCSVCAQFRGFVFSMDKGNPDFPYLDPNRIPFHPNCQCSVIPYVLKYKTNEELDRDIEKAKGFKEGKDHRSNAEKRAYDNQQKLNQIRNQEKKQYAKVKSVMKEDAPKTLGAYRRMRRAKDKKYQMFMKDYYKTINRLKREGPWG